MSGRTSRQGPVSDAMVSELIGDFESDPQDGHGPHGYERNSSDGRSESPKGSFTSVASLDQGRVHHSSRAPQPEVSSFDERQSNIASFKGQGESPYDRREEAGHSSENGRRSERYGNHDEGRGSVYTGTEIV